MRTERTTVMARHDLLTPSARVDAAWFRLEARSRQRLDRSAAADEDLADVVSRLVNTPMSFAHSPWSATILRGPRAEAMRCLSRASSRCGSTRRRSSGARSRVRGNWFGLVFLDLPDGARPDAEPSFRRCSRTRRASSSPTSREHASMLDEVGLRVADRHREHAGRAPARQRRPRHPGRARHGRRVGR